MPSAIPSDLQRYHELTAPGRTLNLFESTELETLEQTFGQQSLPLNTNPKLMPKKTKTNGAESVAETTPALLAEPLPEGVDTIIPAHKIVPSPWNRKHFTEAGLAEMESSIRMHGVLTRPLVRPLPPGLWWIEPGTQSGNPGWFVVPKQLADDLRSRGSSPLRSEFFSTEEAALAAMPTHELVFGERRWRGASRIQVDYQLPVTVRPLSDRQALELQKLENLQREDLDPIEEARGLKQMVVEFGYGVEQLAKQLGKSKSDIYGRIKLASLCDEAVQCFRIGAYSESVATRIARMPAEKMQRAFLQRVGLLGEDGKLEAWDADDDDQVRDAEAARIISDHFMRELKGAPFNIKDAELLPIETNDLGERIAGGACTDCPHRAGNQPGFDPKNGRADMCLNTACFHRKAEVKFQDKAASHVADGGKTLEPDSAKLRKIFHPYGGISYNCGYNEGENRCGDASLPGKKNTSVSYKDLAEHLKIQPVLALNPNTGVIHKLYDEKAIEAAAKEAKLIKPSTSTSRGKVDYQAQQKAAQEERRRNQLVRTAQTVAIVEALTGQTKSEREKMLLPFVKLIGGWLFERVGYNAGRLMCERRGLAPTDEKEKEHYDADEILRAHYIKLKEWPEIISFIAELEICVGPWSLNDEDEQLVPIAKLAGITPAALQKIEKQTIETMDKEAAATAEPAKEVNTKAHLFANAATRSKAAKSAKAAKGKGASK